MFQLHSNQCWDLGLAAELTVRASGFKWKLLDAGGRVMLMWGNILHSTALVLP